MSVVFTIGHRLAGATGTHSWIPGEEPQFAAIAGIFSEVQLLGATITLSGVGITDAGTVEFGFAPSESLTTAGLASGSADVIHCTKTMPGKGKVTLDFTGLDSKIRGTLLTTANAPAVVVISNSANFIAYVKLHCRGTGSVASSA
nr:VP2 [Cat Tien Macrotermes Deltaflexi-like virus]